MRYFPVNQKAQSARGGVAARGLVAVLLLGTSPGGAGV